LSTHAEDATEVSYRRRAIGCLVRRSLDVQHILTDSDLLAAAETCFDDSHPVDPRAVRRADVGDANRGAVELDGSVTPRNLGVCQTKIARGPVTHENARRLASVEVKGKPLVRPLDNRERERVAGSKRRIDARLMRSRQIVVFVEPLRCHRSYVT